MRVYPAELDKYKGQEVWICDYRYTNDNFKNKPIRHLKPTKVLVVHQSTVDKPIYYGDYCFRPIGKKGTPLKRVIPVYDNTGYRSFEGTPCHISPTQSECEEAYREFKSRLAKALDEWWARQKSYYESKLQELNAS